MNDATVRPDPLRSLSRRWRGWFDPAARHETRRHQKVWAAYEIAFTVADVAAALLFVAGSTLLFRNAAAGEAASMFLIGSICFALKPTLRLAREVHYWRMGHVDELAERSGR